MHDKSDPIDLSPNERRIIGEARGYTGRMLEHFIRQGGFEELDWSDDDEAAANAAAESLRGHPQFRNPWKNGVGPAKPIS